MLKNPNLLIHLSKFFYAQQRNISSSLLCSKAFINGSWVDACSNHTFEVTNPANGDVISTVPNMHCTDTQRAINAAKMAFNSEEWSHLTARKRSHFLMKWYHLIERNAKDLAEIVTAESGKPISEAKAEVIYGNSFIEWFAEEARRIYGEIVPSPAFNRETLVIRQPLGVAALITPWNFPLAMITRKAAAALAAGCTVVIKPAPDTPLTALALAKLAEEAGLPKGVINVVTSNKAAPIGEIFCQSPDVRGISFTGSTGVGKLLYRQCADGLKKISLELGGNAPFIVFDSANIEKAVNGAMDSKFRNAGQSCVASNRFFVHSKIYDNFIMALKERVKALRVGPGEYTDTQIGPIINQMQFNRVSKLVEDARCKKANIILGGQALPEIGELFYAPTIITEVCPDAKVYAEEIFGPVICIMKFKTEHDVVMLANATNHGLAAYFYSENVQQIFRVAKQLEVGMVGVNEGLISTAEAPFGGIKESGVGREGSHYGIDEYTELKYICLGGIF